MSLATFDRSIEQRLRAFGLLPAEYEQILERLGREPNMLELGMLGAMWSEHCSYKHSRTLLKLLPTAGPRVLQGPGENAGAVDIGNGLAVVLKMESHNHPSAVEPFEGAATGVGGILRDIFTMGARPVALLDSLRFGDPADPRTGYLLAGVIGGIGHYGNCIGVPTVGGEISFFDGYTGNPIVNAMCVGIAPVARLTTARASGVGNPLLLVGADTGRDGLQGAAFASNDDPEASHRGVVQVGNPFLEKLLLEACLAVLETGEVVAMQDLGAAGLTSSAIEMAARGGLGVEIDVARVPRRETGLSPFEVMLSESQERMLLLVRADAVETVRAHFARWELHAEVVGHVTDDGQIRVRDAAEVVAQLPIALLTEEVPAYDLQASPPPAAASLLSAAVSPPPAAASTPLSAPASPLSAPASPLSAAASRLFATPADSAHVSGEGGSPGHDRGSSATPGAAPSLGAALLELLGAPNLRSRRFAFRQYDSTVQGNTVFGPGQAAAGVIRVEATATGLAMTTDCNPRYMAIDPRLGAAQAVAEAARNLACVGAQPIAVTDCLNFGNPEKPAVAWQLTEAIHGLAEACQVLGVPIVSGNVSLYNETGGRAIPPTPTVGMVGLLADVSLAVPIAFQPGCQIVLLGDQPTRLSAGEYAAQRPAPAGGTKDPGTEYAAQRAEPAEGGTEDIPGTEGIPGINLLTFPEFSLDMERRLGGLLRELVARRWVRSAQDVADGGLAVALVDCVLAGGTGATLALPGSAPEAALFSEDQGRAVVTCQPDQVGAIIELAAAYGVPVAAAGTTGGDRLVIGDAIDLSLDSLRAAWEAAS